MRTADALDQDEKEDEECDEGGYLDYGVPGV